MEPFYVKDCTLVAIATGIKASTLAEFRDRLLIVPSSCFFYHFWGGRLRASFEYREYHNDFSHWAHNSLHDDILAERIELIDPTEYKGTDNLIAELFEIVENRVDERESLSFSKEPFHFIESKIIVFDTPFQASKPQDFINIIPHMSHSSIFFHFIESTLRLPDQPNDFNMWLAGWGESYHPLAEAIKKIDPYFISLSDLQQKLIGVFDDYFLEKEYE